MLHSSCDDAGRYLFLEGSNAYAYSFLGAHPQKDGGRDGFVFRVWAPAAKSVHVTGDFNFWNESEWPMKDIGYGIWECFIPGIKEFDTYKYSITTFDGQSFMKADPFAFHAETRPGTASKTYDPEGYRWTDEEWLKNRASFDPYHSPVNIYEMNLGSWKRDEEGRVYTYERIADELIPYILDMGYTHVEFMPLTEYPFDGSWGYQVTGYFAPTSRYGEPKELMKLIDRLHNAGIGVIMDWVPAHFPKDAFGLRRFDGSPLFEYSDPRLGENEQWGTNRFDFGKGGVRSFLMSSAVYWLKEYHLDGLRVDAVSFMIYLNYCKEDDPSLRNIYGGNENLEAISLLQKINEIAYRDFPGVMMMAEEATAFPMVTKPKYMGGLGFGFKWNMGWMNDILSYIKLDPIYRSYHHNKLTFSLMYAFNENFVLSLSHDEVVHGKCSLLNKMPGDYWQKFAGLRTLFAYQYAHPGKKLNFMGSEYGQFIEWKDDDQLDWFLLDYDNHKAMQDYVRDLNALYRLTPALWQIDDSWDGFSWLEADDNQNSVLAFFRQDKDGRRVVAIINFTPQYLPSYRIGMPNKGRLDLLICSDDIKYAGSGKGMQESYEVKDGLHKQYRHYVDIELAPLAGMIYSYEYIQEPDPKNDETITAADRFVPEYVKSYNSDRKD